jgi:signal transduction histidine kinase/tetratricopeptide (TPR) repeat protein
MENSSSSNANLVYESETTRVTRPDTHGHVCKQARGANGHDRIRHEFNVLQLLAGVDGVVQVRGVSTLRSEIDLSDAGQSLAQILSAGRLPLAHAIGMAEQLARVLSAVHRMGVTHRDLCPANIALESVHPLAAPSLIDFDHAQATGLHSTYTPPSIGTLAYAAPELSGRTAQKVDHRADLYSLGVILYELVVGSPPFRSDDPLKLLHDHLTRDPIAPSALDSSIPAVVSQIILRLLAKDPDARYQSAEGLMHDLRRARTADPGETQEVFRLGEFDFALRFAPPAQPVGRDAELQLLRNAFRDAVETERKALVIEGEAGMGKSVLLGELRLLAEQAGGMFLYGKFDQFQHKHATMGGVSQALLSLARQLMPGSARDFGAERARVLDYLKRNPYVANLLPELGEAQPVDTSLPVDAKQAEQALLDTTIEVLRAVVSPQTPLVLALDDVQWSGATSLRILDRLTREEGLRGLLLAITHRPADGRARSLSEALARWDTQPEPARRISLAGLPLPALEQLLIQVLRLPESKARQLACLLEELTSGNPMEILELLNALRSDALLQLTQEGWQWDAKAIRGFVSTGSSQERLAARIAKLPRDSKEPLEAMSCLGTPVDLGVLQGATALERDKLVQVLRAPAEDDLIIIEPDTVRFRHDVVQHAVIASLGLERRAGLQLSMARRLAAAGAINEAAQQYLGCAGYIVDSKERDQVAQTLHQVGKSLAMRGRLEEAELHFLQAEQLAEPSQGATYDEILIDRHAVLVVLARGTDADSRYALLESRIRDPQRLAPATSMQARSLELRGRRGDALELCRDMLRRLGVHVPDDLHQQGIGAALDGAIEWVRDLRSRGSPPMHAATDPSAIAAGQLVFQMAKGDIGGTHEFIWARLESFRLWRETGATPLVAGTMLAFAQMLALLRQDYRAAYDLGNHVVDTARACGFAAINVARLQSNLLYLAYFFEPVEDCMESLARLRHLSQSFGDHAPAAYASRRVGDFLFEYGSLAAAEAEYDDAVELARRSGFVSWVGSAQLRRQRARMLRGNTSDPTKLDDVDFNEAQYRAQMGAGSIAYADLSRAHCDLILGDIDAMLERNFVSPPLEPWKEGDPTDIALTLLWVAPDYVLTAIRAAEQLRRTPEVDRANRLETLDRCRAWLDARAHENSSNFLHLANLVRAEQAWVQGNLYGAASFFDAARMEVRHRRSPRHKALIAERAALFHLSHGMQDCGEMLMAQARELYAEWGADAKVRLLDRQYPSLRPATRLAGSAGTGMQSGAHSSDSLDLMGMLRASQLLSSQRAMPELVASMTQVLAELTGATRVTLILPTESGEWMLVDAAHQDQVQIVPAQKAVRAQLLPASVLSRLEGLREPLQAPDIARDDRFTKDPYFAGRAAGSLLLVPIISQGSTAAVLFLENSSMCAAFSAQRLDAVLLISGQLAVSVANAQLYEQLERRVRERTAEIQELQKQLVVKAHRSGMAQIATNVLHNVNNVLSSVTVAAGQVKGRVFNSRVGGLARAVALMKEQTDLARFFEEDPRGRVLPKYLEQLAETLAQEREETIGDIGILQQSIEHIAAVVNSQQAFAGSSKWKESVSVTQLLDEALLMCGPMLGTGTLVQLQDEVNAEVEIDKSRVLQILVNLIANASDAMKEGDLRKLTLGAQLKGAPPSALLLITVGDTGHGIDPEDMARLFSHGFTTKIDGHGFGLHSASIAAKEMGGALNAHSDGVGLGASFTLEIPLSPRSLPSQEPALP